MHFTQQDRAALYDIWMAQKAKMRMTQMEMAKRLGMPQVDFANLIKGSEPLTLGFVTRFCELMCINPAMVLPAYQPTADGAPRILKNRFFIEGEIKNVYTQGSEIVVEYTPPC
ncbi:XRE family transcriptional regulator [Thaumasiovibrio sp. DFM-14]|uniref:XRE family transcriptional regulator n=1 Tax=Thaumasiovibrio sp. DFM-14 TaxID=3384792 RepID=UPI0039A0B52D